RRPAQRCWPNMRSARRRALLPRFLPWSCAPSATARASATPGFPISCASSSARPTPIKSQNHLDSINGINRISRIQTSPVSLSLSNPVNPVNPVQKIKSQQEVEDGPLSDREGRNATADHAGGSARPGSDIPARGQRRGHQPAAPPPLYAAGHLSHDGRGRPRPADLRHQDLCLLSPTDPLPLPAL